MTLGAMQRKQTKTSTNINRKGNSPNEAMEDGIYRNPRAAHVAASLIGCTVQVRVKNGTIYDGILTTISPELSVALDQAHKCNENGSDVCLPLSKDTTIIETMVINWNDVVTMSALAVDLSFATKESFTDTAISRSNGQPTKEKNMESRNLEPFECDGPLVDGLDDSRENGWSPDAMFSTNETKFTVHSSFSADLSQYTTPLPNENSADYREKEERARRLAMEIEGNDNYRRHVEMENGGEDEEMAFSAVHRNPRKGNSHQQNSQQYNNRRSGPSMNGPRPGRGGTSGGRGGPSGLSSRVPQQTNSGSMRQMSSSQGSFPSHQPMVQTSPKPGGFNGQDNPPENRFQPQDHKISSDARPDYGRQLSGSEGRASGSEGRAQQASVESKTILPHGDAKSGAAQLQNNGDGKSPQTAKDSRKPVMPSVDKGKESIGGGEKNKPAWGNNQSPLPPRNEMPSRAQVPPTALPPRAQTSDQKSVQKAGNMKENQKIQDLQKFQQQFNMQLSSEADQSSVRDIKTSPRSSVQHPPTGPSPHPSPQRPEQEISLEAVALALPGVEPIVAKLHEEVPNHGATKVEDNKASGDKISVDEDAELEKKKQLVTTSKLNPNAKEFNPTSKPANVYPKPITSPTPARGPPSIPPTAPVPGPAAAQTPIIMPTYITHQMPQFPVMMPTAASQIRALSAKRVTVSANGRQEQAQAATGQPLVSQQPSVPGYHPLYSVVPQSPLQPMMQTAMPTRILDPNQLSAQQQLQQQPVAMIVGQQGVPLTQHMVNQATAPLNSQVNANSHGGPGAHPSSSPVHQQQMQPPQTPTSGTPQPQQIYYSQQQQQHSQIMAAQNTPISLQQQTVYSQPHLATLQQQYAVGPVGTYQFTAGGQQFMQQHIAAPHGMVQISGPAGILHNQHMQQQAQLGPVIVQQQQSVQGQPHPAQLQQLMGQAGLAHPGGVSNQPTQVANMAPPYLTQQALYVPAMPYMTAQQQSNAFHAASHVASSGMPSFQTSQ